MNRFYIAILTIIAVYLVVSPTRPTSLAYVAMTTVEARFAGLRKEFIELDDARVAVYQTGSRNNENTLVLLHGYTASKEVWIRFAREMGGKFRIVIPDLAGHGESGFDASWDFSPSAQAKRTARLLDRMDIRDKVIVAGNSMGGAVAATFAADFPERTRALVLFNPSGLRTPKPSEADLMFDRGESPFQIASHDEFKSFYPMTMASPPWIPGFILKEIGIQYQERRVQYDRILKDLRIRDQMEGRLGQIKAPTLIIWGRLDRLIDVSGAEVWRRGIYHSELRVFENLGHMPMLERPSASARTVKAFLSKFIRLG